MSRSQHKQVSTSSTSARQLDTREQPHPRNSVIELVEITARAGLDKLDPREQLDP
ncbi:hypothetical protein [Nocardioides alcanivorans]|uniref:hypothetical protein n=1 Tax=Nocardioides alcanivorans TaxID=2897352 RepID=UPI001F32D24A|nr:hypothetical protein [Nocardioides alcanivorans]